jgi:hypothetical protein
VHTEPKEPLPGEDIEETPLPETEQPPELPEEGPEPTKDREELGTIPSATQAPSPSVTAMTDDEIFENIKKKYEEGKISQETFDEIEKRYKKK